MPEFPDPLESSTSCGLLTPAAPTSEAGGAARHLLQVHILAQGLAAGVHLEDGHAALHIGAVNSHLWIGGGG